MRPLFEDCSKQLSTMLPHTSSKKLKKKLITNVFTKSQTTSTLNNSSSIELKRISRYPTLQSCRCDKLRCGNKLSESWRRRLHNRFWNINSFNVRKQWIIDHAARKEKNCLRSRTKSLRKWFLPDTANRMVQVCRIFFLKTIDYRWNTVLNVMLKLPPFISFGDNASKWPGNKTKDSLKRRVFMHIKSFLRKYHSRMKSRKGSQKCEFDYNIVKRCFNNFKAFHPFQAASYRFFRKHFCAAFAVYVGDNTYASIMPDTVLLSQAYRECDLSYFEHRNHCHDSEKHSGIMKTEPQPSFNIKHINRMIKAINDKHITQDKMLNENKKVIMHLDTGNDDVVIIQNVSDSDTEDERDEVNAQVVINSVVNNRPSNHETVPCNSHILKSKDLAVHHGRETQPQPTCASQRQCFNKLTDSRKQEIYMSFWNLGDSTKQKQWILKHRHKPNPRLRITKRKGDMMSYFLTDEAGRSVTVCAVCFQRTLGIRDGNWLENLNNCPDKVFEKEQLNEVEAIMKNCGPQDITNKRASESKLGMYTTGVLPPESLHRKLHNNQKIQYPESHASCDKSGTFLRHADVRDQKVGNSQASVSFKKLSISRNLRNSRKCLLANYMGGSSEVLERRSTRMQGNMAKDNLIKEEDESCLMSAVVSTIESYTKQKNTSNFCSVKIISTRSKNVNSSQRIFQQQKISSENNCDIKLLSPALDQTGIKSHLYPENRGRSKIGQRNCIKRKKHIMSKHKSRKNEKESMKESEVLQMNYHKNLIKAKKDCTINSLKKKHKHPILPSCNCSRRKCIEMIPEEVRKQIHEHFWNLSSSRNRKQWLMKFVEKRARKNKVLSLLSQRKNESKKYFLPDGMGQPKEVCRLFFIHTLGFKWDSVVDAVVKVKTPTDTAEQSQLLKKVPRKLPDNVVESVKLYLKSVQESLSSARDSEAVPDNRKKTCVENSKEHAAVLKVKDLFKNWKAKYKSLKFNLGYHSFRRIFQSVVNPAVSSDDLGASGDGIISKDHEHQVSDLDSGLCDDAGGKMPPLLPMSEISYTDNSFENHEDLTTTNSSDGKPASSTCLNETESARSKQESSTSSGSELKALKYTESINKESEVRNDLQRSEESTGMTKEADDCILDVGSGCLKRVGSIEKQSLYIQDCKYNKKRSLSVRNDRSNYPVLSPCKCRKRKCGEKFTEVQRQKINDMFWNLGSYNERKQWILEHIKRADIKRRVVFNEGAPRKLESRWYYLPDDNGKKIDVCKAFFLRTLGYRWDSIIDTIGKTTPKGDKWAAPDKRGRKPPPHKISDEAVSSMTLYIENVCHTYQPVYQQKSQNIKNGSKPGSGNLIPYGLTMKQLFEDYKSKHTNHKFGYESFRKTFRRVHGAFLASLPSDLESSEDPDLDYSDVTVQVNNGYSKHVDADCVSNCLPQSTEIIPTTESYSNVNHYTPPPAPSALTPPPVVHAAASHHEPSLQPQIECSLPEPRSCLFQYSDRSCESQQIQPALPMEVHDSVRPVNQDPYNAGDHDPFMKYSHSLYCQSVGVSGHFSHMDNQLAYTNGISQRLDVSDQITCGGQNHQATCGGQSHQSTCGGQSQFHSYYIPNPEPLRHQAYHMASQYQSILHQIAGSGRFLNYGSFPYADPTFQGNHDKQIPYVKQQDFHRDNVSTYNISKTCHSYISESSSLPTQYPPLSRHLDNNIQQGSAPMTSSQYSERNDNRLEEESCLIKDQQTSSGLGCEFSSDPRSKNSNSKNKISSKMAKSDKTKEKKEKKIRQKSVRNHGDHYPMLSPCHCKKKKCTDTFLESDRQRVHDLFWGLKDYNERKQWMLAHIKRDDCKRRRIDQFESFRKQESRWYFFPDKDGSQHEVCKDFFLRTLGYKWDSVIDTIRRTTPKGESNSRPDQRGRKTPAHKLSNVVLRSVVQYIESMQQVSQPLSGDIPALVNRQVNETNNPNTDQSIKNTIITSDGQISIPYGLTMKDLYDDYKFKHTGHKIGYESFRRIFRALSKSEKVVSDIGSGDDELLNPDNNYLIDL